MHHEPPRGLRLRGARAVLQLAVQLEPGQGQHVRARAVDVQLGGGGAEGTEDEWVGRQVG